MKKLKKNFLSFLAPQGRPLGGPVTLVRGGNLKNASMRLFVLVQGALVPSLMIIGPVVSSDSVLGSIIYLLFFK